jgi:hypothetical protein
VTVRPPRGPADPPEGSAEALRVSVDRTAGEPSTEAAFADRIAKAAPSSPDDPVGLVAARVRAGVLSVPEAVAALIEEALDERLASAMSEERRELLRTELADLFASDPVLSQLAARLRR